MNEKRFNQIARDIKSVKIQGATNVAKAGIKAFLLNPNPEHAKKIINLRPTEPFLQNAIYSLLNSKNPEKTARKYFDYAEKSHKKIAKYGSSLIKNGMNIFTHCHSSTVLDILKYAKKQGKKFTVYNTETEPLMQGRQTAKELAKIGIPVIYAPDLAAEDSLKKCHLFLFGADAYLRNKIVNKTGTNMLCEIAYLHNIPRYSCGISLRYTKKVKIEMRPAKEVWDNRNNKIIIFNPAFSVLKSKYITGVISEFGILPYKKFIKLAKKNVKKFRDN